MRGTIEEEYVWMETLDYAYNHLPETKCPDLGDWSDTPHDELDNWPIPRDGLTGLAWFDCGLKELASRVARIQKKRLIELDRERLLSYIED
jgi:hypothetical protein